MHDYGSRIIGRMGLPYREKDISIISIAVDAPQDVISALSGKLGRLPGVSTKALYSKVTGKAGARYPMKSLVDKLYETNNLCRRNIRS